MRRTAATRIAGAITAYACGDALGVGWEGKRPDQISADATESLPAREGWTSGATSDDTALTLIVADHLLDNDGPGTATGLLARIAAQPIPGIGPSTRNAIAAYDATGKPPTTAPRSTNGAAMRALPAGWARADPDQRRQWTDELSRATHPDPRAMRAARTLAACASATIDGATGRDLLDVATATADDTLHDLLSAVAAGTWRPPAEGIGLDPDETTAAVLFCAGYAATTLREGLVNAVRLGGDTDTVAALVGGLLGASLSPAEVRDALPWSTSVALPDPATIDRLAEGLAALRNRP